MIKQYDSIEIDSDFTEGSLYKVDHLVRTTIGGRTISVMTTEGQGERLRLIYDPDGDTVIQTLEDRHVSGGTIVDSENIWTTNVNERNRSEYNFPEGWGLMSDEEKSEWFLKRRAWWQLNLQYDNGMWQQWDDVEGKSLREGWNEVNNNEFRFK